MQGQVILVSTGIQDTCPDIISVENGRQIFWPRPGEILRYHSEEEVVSVLNEAVPKGSPFLEKFQWVPGGTTVGIGMAIFEDYLEKRLKDEVIPLNAGTKEFILEPKRGDERANDRAFNWKQYGALRIDGLVPTSDEIELAKSYRKTYAEQRLTEVIDWQQKRRGGMRGVKPNFDRSDRAWADEFGVALVNTLELLPRSAGAQKATATTLSADEGRIPCPECGEAIKREATVCHFCRAKFKIPVSQEIARRASAKVESDAIAGTQPVAAEMEG